MENFIKVYLDLNHWIALAQANTEHNIGQQYKKTLSYLLEKVREGKVVFPLSSTHYMELANIRDYRQRKDLTNVMSALSGFRTLSAKNTLQTAEIEHALNKIIGIPLNPTQIKPIGLGCFFAFTGESKVLQLKGDPDGIKKLEFSLGGKEKLDSWKVQVIYESETMLLSGVSDTLISELRDKYGYKPEAATEIAERRTSQEQELATILTTNPKLKSKIDDIVNARYLYYELSNNLIEILSRNGLVMHDFLKIGKEKISSFIQKIPTALVATTLLKANFKNLNRAWQRNDIYDLDAISIAVPYCDIVVTDKHVAAQLNKFRVGEQCSTIIISRLIELPSIIEKSLSTVS